MLFFPLYVDVPMVRWLWMNWLLMLGILVCYTMEQTSPELMERLILGVDGFPSGIFDASSSSGFFDFVPQRSIDEHPLSWIGHMFLHAGFLHLIGNLLFMWVFGNAVCAKLGNIWYLPLWIGFGLIAAIAQSLFSDAAMLGASGAINGIVGAYLILYPVNDITMFYWVIFRAGTFALGSIWMILLWLGFDVLGAVSGGGGAAYFAHLGGFFAGACLLLMALRLGFVAPTELEKTVLDFIGQR